MNDIISNHEFRELLRHTIKKGYKLVTYIMAGLAVFYGFLALFFSIVMENSDEFTIYFLIPVFIVTVIGYIFYYLAKRVDEKESPHYSYDQFVDYQTPGTKIPMYRVVNYGKSSQTIYILVDLNGEKIQIYDHKKKGLKLYLNGNKHNTKFKFYYKNKHGFDIIKKRVDMIVNGSKYKLYGYPEINENMIDFFKLEGYQTEIK